MLHWFGTAPQRHLDYVWLDLSGHFLQEQLCRLCHFCFSLRWIGGELRSWRRSLHRKMPPRPPLPRWSVIRRFEWWVGQQSGGPVRKVGWSTKYRTTKSQVQASLSQLAYLLDYNWLIYFDASVRPLLQKKSAAKMVHRGFSSRARTSARKHDASKNHHLPGSSSWRWTSSISRPFPWVH